MHNMCFGLRRCTSKGADLGVMSLLYGEGCLFNCHALLSPTPLSLRPSTFPRMLAVSLCERISDRVRGNGCPGHSGWQGHQRRGGGVQEIPRGKLLGASCLLVMPTLTAVLIALWREGAC